MISGAEKKQALDRIRGNIARSGHHVYMVMGRAVPRFAYTIGVSESIGVELIMAGALFYLNGEVAPIINNIAAQLRADRNREVLEVDGKGKFALRKVHPSWATKFILGVLDYYQVSGMPTLQLVPDEDHRTVDVPDMSEPWSATEEPVWQWLHKPWTYPISEKSVTATDLAALRGERITEARRWEDDEWEIFAAYGPDVRKDEMRQVPLGTLAAVDESLVAVMNLRIGEGLVRDADAHSEWRPMAQA